MSYPRRSAAHSHLFVSLLAAASFAFAAESRADLTLEATANPDPAQPGEWVAVNFTLSNDGGTDLEDVVLTSQTPAADIDLIGCDIISNGSVVDSVEYTGGTCQAGDLVTWNIGTLAAGQGITIPMPARVSSGGAAPADGTVINFPADATATGAADAAATASVTIEASPVLELTMQASTDPLVAGDSISYRLTYGQLSDLDTAIAAAITFPVPAGLTFASATGGGFLNNGDVEWQLGDLGPGQSGVVEARFTSNGLAGGGTVVADATFADANLFPNEARAGVVTRVVAAAPSLNLEISATPDPVRPAGWVYVNMTISNNGGSTLANVSLQTATPTEHIDLLDCDTISNDSSASSVTFTGGTCQAGDLITWNFAGLAAGDSKTINAPMRVSSVGAAPPNGTTIAFAADVVADGVAHQDAFTTVVVQDDPIIDLTLHADRDPVIVGDTVRYRIAYGQRSDSEVALGATLTMPVPDGLTFQSATGGVLSGDNVEWALGDVGPGQNGVLHADFLADGVSDGDAIKSQVALMDTNTVPNAARANLVTRVVDSTPRLSLSMAVNPDPVRPGQWLIAKLTVMNTTGGNVSAVSVQADTRSASIQLLDCDTITNGSNATSVTFTGGTCQAGDLVTWNLGTLPPRQGMTLLLPMRVFSGGSAPSDGTLIPFTADASAPSSTHVDAGTSIVVEAEPQLELALSPDYDPIVPGSEVTYTIEYGQRTDSGVSLGTVLSLPVPDDLTFQSASGGGNLVGDAVEWQLSDLGPGYSGRLQAIFVATDVSAGDAVRASATIRDANLFPNETRALLATRVHTDLPAVTLAMSANPDPAIPGEFILTELTVTNTRVSPVAGIFLKFLMPKDDTNQPACDFIRNGNGADEAFFSGGSCSSNDHVRLDLGALAGGEGTTVTIPMRVAAGSLAPPTGSLIDLDARVTAGGIPETLASGAIIVVDDPIIDLHLSADQNPLPAGNPVEYTLRYGNQSDSDPAFDATLTLPVPDGLVFDSATDGGQLIDNAIVWGPADINPGEYGVVKATFDSPGVAAGDAVSAHAVLADTAARMNSHQANRTIRVSDTEPPLTLLVALNPTAVRAHDGITARLIATNNTDSNRIEQRMEFFFNDEHIAANPQNESQDGLDCSSTACNVANRITWIIDALAPGESTTRTMTFQAQSVVKTGATFDFSAVLRDSGAEVHETESISLDNTPLFEIAVGTGQGSASPGDLLNFGVHYGLREGATARSDVVLEMPIPVGTEVVQVSGNGRVSVDMVSWDIGDLQPGDADQRMAYLRPTGAGGDVITARAKISDSDGEEALTKIDIPVVDAPPLELTGRLIAGDFLKYGQKTATLQWTVRNTTGATRSSIGLDLLLPPEGVDTFPFDNISDGGTCAPSCGSARTVSWDLGSLDAGKSKTVTVELPAEAGCCIDRPVDGSLLNFHGILEDPTYQTTSEFVIPHDRDPLPVHTRLPEVATSNDRLSVLEINGAGTQGGFAPSALADVSHIAALRDNTNTIRVELREFDTGRFVRWIDFLGAAWRPLILETVPDLNGNGAEELVVLAVRFSDGTIVAQIRDSVTGDRLANTFFLGPEFDPVDLKVLPDLDASGNPEIALLAVNKINSTFLVQTRDTLTGAIVSNINYLGPGFLPLDLVLVPDSDSNGIPELAVLALLRENNNFLTQVKNATGPAMSRNYFYLGRTFEPLGASIIDDANGDGVPDIAVAAARRQDRKFVVQTRNTFGAAGPNSSFYFDPEYRPLGLVTITDGDNDTKPEAGLLAFRRNNNLFAMQYRNMSPPRRPRNAFYLDSNWFPVGVIVGPDTNADGFVETAVMGRRLADGRLRIQIRNVNGNKTARDIFLRP